MNWDRIILPSGIDVVVVSYGGVGTTFLLRYLAEHKNTNHPSDGDGFKHAPLPPISFNPNLKFIYVYGSPQLAVISLFRRNFQRAQSRKLQQWSVQPTPLIPKWMTLQEYASLGVDRFGFRNHFYNWYEKYLAHPTLFLRYETIFEHQEDIFDFLNIPKSHLDCFPKKKERASSSKDVPNEILEQLDRMYGPFSDELAQLSDVEIRIPAHSNPLAAVYFKRPYPKALIRQFYKGSKSKFKSCFKIATFKSTTKTTKD